jgi:hypothetical protein
MRPLCLQCLRPLACTMGSALLALMMGCSANFGAVSTPTTPSALGEIRGTVFGGQQPVVGASVSLYAAANAGYSAASTLLTPIPAITDTTGSFSLTGTYTCTAGQQVYIYVSGGDPSGTGLGSNSAIGLMSVLGTCPASRTLATTFPVVQVNEVSTIAAAYAMAPFALDATHVGSSGTPLALTGIASAFVNASKIYNVTGAAGQGASKTGAIGSGIVPQALVNALANILAACVNTVSTIGTSGTSLSTNCQTLLSTATSDGTATGTVPTDTATAAINIAHHPGLNTAKLFGLISATPPFQPSNTGGTDLALYVVYENPTRTIDIAIDASGDVWFGQTYVVGTNPGDGATGEYSNAGQILSTSVSTNASGYGGGVITPYGVAIDPSGNAWVASRQYPAFSDTATNIKYSPTGQVLSGTSGFPDLLDQSVGLAIDSYGNVWSADIAYDTIAKMSPSGVLLSPTTPQSGHTTPGFAPSGLNGPTELAIDTGNNVWICNNYALVEIDDNGATLSGTNGITAGGLSVGSNSGVAIDHAGDVWVSSVNNSSLIEVGPSSSGIKSPGNGFTDASINQPARVAIDGDGNVWSSQQGGEDISELSNTGVPLSGAYGYTGGGGVSNGSVVYGISAGAGIAVDGAGDVWVAATTGILNGYVLNDPAIYEFIGIAAPVVTPLAAGIANNTLGTRP